MSSPPSPPPRPAEPPRCPRCGRPMGTLAASGAADATPGAAPDQWYCGCCGVVVPAEGRR